MKSTTLILLISILISIVICFPSQLQYQVNEEFVYSVTGYLDARGNLVNGSRTSGSFSTMNGTLVTECIQVNSNYYMFVMNMFDVVVGVGQGPANGESVANEKNGLQPHGAGDVPLGYDVYYQQFFNGSIPTVWVNSADSPYYINVKLGAINAFQTKILPPKQKMVVLESDPVGVHTANVAGSSASETLVLTKTFNQNNFQQFSDKNVKSSMLKLNAVTTTTVHSSGYIVTSSVDQFVNMVNMAASGEQREKKSVNGAESTTGFDMTLSSRGTLNINLLQNGQQSGVQTAVFNRYSSKEELEKDTQYKSSSLTEAARQATMLQTNQKAIRDIEPLLPQIFSSKTEEKDAIKMMKKVIKHMKVKMRDIDKLMPYISRVNEPHVANRLFYILSSVGNDYAQVILAKKGIKSSKSTVQIQALLAVSHLKQPNQFIMKHVKMIAKSHSDERIRRLALISYTNLVKSSANKQAKRELKRHLLKNLESQLKKGDASDCAATILLFKNAGIELKESEIPLSSLADLRNNIVNSALVDLFPQSQMIKKISQYQISNASQFPFNKSYSDDIDIGGSEVSVDFDGTLFAGTNFDCNQPTFNYEVLAQLIAKLSLFGLTADAADARAIYGKANGVVVGDDISLVVFGKLIYEQKLPVLDCSLHTYPIAHTAPGFDVSYTVWVSIIPITFSADASLVLDLKWGWEVCDSPLLAEVELIPSASFVLSGNAEINLLLLEAGLQLDGALNTELLPQAKINGSECAVDFDLEWVNTPMSANFNGYYAWQSCAFLIFDCHWGEHHVHDFWQWSLPSHNEVIYDKSFKIIQ